MKKLNLIILVLLTLIWSCTQTVDTSKNNKLQTPKIESTTTPITYKKLDVDGINIAYRESGNPEKPTVVLLHGFPSSSHQYRKVLHQLSDEYHLIAPDYPGFGNSDFPSTETYEYTFDNLAKTTNAFLEKKGINSYAVMIQDFGAPVGLRIAVQYPERITAIINQNGNAYTEGLGKAWKDIKVLWNDRNKATEEALYPAFTIDGLKWQYTHGTRNEENINPDNWNLDYLRLSRPNARNMALDLLFDYQNNLNHYPEWQKYFRDNQPPLLIVWGKNDEFFPESGAEAFKKDVKNIDYHIYNTGHFALEEDGDDIINKMRVFLKRELK